MKVVYYILAILISLTIISCGEKDIITPEQETLLYENSGLVDSAVVYGCYSYTLRHFVPDTFDVHSFSTIRVEFDGNTNSDGTSTFIIMHSETMGSVQIYQVHQLSGINMMHNFSHAKQYDECWFEVRLYINPPVCGNNEFKFNSARNLRIYGVK